MLLALSESNVPIVATEVSALSAIETEPELPLLPVRARVPRRVKVLVVPAATTASEVLDTLSK